MRFHGKRVLVCNCENTMPLDAERLTRACAAAGGEGRLALSRQLCRAQLDTYQDALGRGDPLLVACTQEAPLFSEVRDETAADAEVAFANIREYAGWSETAESATPKIAALLAAASLESAPAPSVEMESSGVCLVYGHDQTALEAARQLSGRLEVTLLLTAPEELIPPRVMAVPVFKGRISRAEGHLGAFRITVDDYAPAVPSSRGALLFEAPRDGAVSECDLILDLTGGPPMFPGHDRRDGYFRPDPGNPAAVQKALFELSDLVGQFEKPRYVDFDAEICAHSRSRQTGCTRCLQVCPTGAITPAGDHVSIEPHICAGCGTCASVCPTGAATYRLPKVDDLFQRLRTLLSAYHAAGGNAPSLLLHDPRHGDDMIAVLANLGPGLPPDVLPFTVNEVTQVGLDFLASALAYGAARVGLLVGPDKQGELEGLAGQIGLVETVMEALGFGGGRIVILDQQDPDALAIAFAEFRGLTPPRAGSFLPMGGKRSRSMLALRHLHEVAPEPRELIELPRGAPFGRVKIDAAGCTLCLACVSVCPTGALLDDPDRPWLGFQEEACIQCGLCRNTCPESVIELEPRLNLSEEARRAITLNEAEPFNCIRCGKPFGVQRSIERIVEKLAGRHSMFQAGEQIERIMMCDDCRVVVQFERSDEPMAMGQRPKPRTTDDYLREREIEQARAKVLAERSGGSGEAS